MTQQYIAIIIILFFISRLFWQKKKHQISGTEFLFWFVFWNITALAIVFIKKIDIIVAKIGFSGTGIEILLYLAVAILFFLIFRLRLKMEKMENNLTKIISDLAINNKK